MEEVTLDQVPRKIRDLYEKAMAALERGNAATPWTCSSR
jgi:hypothetical protein